MTELHDEFCVVVTQANGEQKFTPIIGNHTWATVEEAQAWIDYIAERRVEHERKAADEDVTKGNMYTYSWNNPRDGEKFSTYRIVHRRVSKWADV